MITPIQEIKERLDIADFIRSYIPLSPAGKNLKALCPFHKEKTPSFMVSPERQTWHCFGACGEGGDIFKFLMKYENLEFYEALKVLAEKAGVELKKISPVEQKQFGVLYDINQSAKDFFKKELEKSTKALNYLKDRGLKKEIVEEFELGLSPQEFDALTRHLINLGYDIKDVERAGLNYKTERGSYVDRFRGRIIFPFYNHFGKAAGFSGRILPELENADIGKYINSPETLIFNKSKVLYGFHKTKESVRQQQSVILVEGQMDFLMVYQDGIRNVVATSGTALTVEHLKTLRRLTDKLILYFDNDEAGFKAAERAIDLANASDFNARILTLADFKDPAEIVQKSPGTLTGLINKTKPAMEFYFDRYLSIPEEKEENKKEKDFSGFKKGLKIILGKIKKLASAVERNCWLKELSLRTEIEERALAEEMEQLKSENWLSGELVNGKIKISQPINQASGQLRRKELICQRLISLIVLDNGSKEEITDYLNYFPADYLSIWKHITEKTDLNDEKLVNLSNLIYLRSSFESSILDEEKIGQEFHELLRQLKSEHLKEKKQELSHSLKEAERNNDETKIKFVLEQFNEIAKQLNGQYN